jgi:hypothetical protein
VLVDSDQRHRFGRSRVAKSRCNSCPWQAHAALWAGGFAFDQFTVFCATRGICGHCPFAILLFVDWLDASTFGGLFEDADNFCSRLPNAPNNAGLIGMIAAFYFGQLAQNAITGTKCGIRLRAKS